MALTESTMELDLGAEAPDFALTDVVTGKTVRRDDFRGQKGLAALGMDYDGEPVSIVAVGSNDAETYPDDAPEGLKRQAETMGFRFPYLYDETQNVARAYHAACTPDLFLFDGDLKLAYRGQFDASRPGNGVPVTGQDLRAAMDAVLAGKRVPKDQRPSIGCNIKWKG